MKRVFLESLPVFQVCFPVTLWWAKGSVLLSQITVSQRLAHWKWSLVKYTGTLLLKGIVEASNKSRRQIKWPDCSVDVHSHQRMNHKHFGQEPTPQSAHDNLMMMTGRLPWMRLFVLPKTWPIIRINVIFSATPLFLYVSKTYVFVTFFCLLYVRCSQNTVVIG